MNPRVTAAAQGIAFFGYRDIAGVADWRERIHWPIAHAEFAATARRVPGAIIASVASLTEAFERQVATVACGVFGGGFLSLLEAALVCQEAERLGLAVVGGPSEMPLLAGRGESFAVQEYHGFRVKAVPKAWLRAVARTASWTPAHRLPRALVAPEAVAITYNPLLVRATEGRAIGFRHAPNIVAQASSANVPDVRHLADKIAADLIPLAPMLTGPYRERLRQAFNARLGAALTRIAEGVAALRQRKLPANIWSGTNGFYPSRAVASEVLRRGGRVESFDHGGASGISQLPGSTALIELCTSNVFHLATPEWADLVAATDAVATAAPLNRAELAGGRGDASFRDAFRDGTERKGARPRVIMVGHPFRGLRQFPVAALSDAIYWDFQIDLVQQLTRMNIDVLCKPHPEGEFRGGQRNPLEDMAPTSYRRFEEHLDDADVFLFDAPTSTTFLKSLCTRRRVVLIDRGYGFSPAAEPHIRARCRLVGGRFDERNRFRVDFAELEEAICGAGPEPDPSYFRRLTGGQQSEARNR